jgi:hypothetical protein
VSEQTISERMRPQHLFPAILAVALLVRLAYLALVPWGVAVGPMRLEGLNDEPSHYNYICFLSDSLRLPVQTHAVDEAGAFVRNDFEYYQPPLYYLAGAAIDKAVGREGSRWACRALSLAAGLLTLWALWMLGGGLGLGRDARAGMVAFGALMPVHAYFSSMVSNDSLAWLWCLLVLNELVRLVLPQRAPAAAWRQHARLALFLTAGMLTKNSLVVLYPAAALAVIALWKRQGARPALALAGALGVSIALAAPWYLRNLHLYGSMSALQMACGSPRTDITRWPVFVDFVKYSVKTIWYPMQNVPGSRGAGVLGYAGALLIAAVAVLSGRRWA